MRHGDKSDERILFHRTGSIGLLIMNTTMKCLIVLSIIPCADDKLFVDDVMCQLSEIVNAFRLKRLQATSGEQI